MCTWTQEKHPMAAKKKSTASATAAKVARAKKAIKTALIALEPKKKTPKRKTTKKKTTKKKKR